MADFDSTITRPLRLALPKGRMEKGVEKLLADAGIELGTSDRTYRPRISIDGFSVKVLKPQNIVEMLHVGSRDLGFAGADWVAELNANIVEIVDTGLDPVRLVAAAPSQLLERGELPKRRMRVASEYEVLTRQWLSEREIRAEVVRSFGATEVFPPEDADFITDITATGATLVANGLVILDEIHRSSTRLFAGVVAMDDPARRNAIEGIALLIRSVLEARTRVMLEANVPADRLDAVIALLPCMREPTISRLHGGAGFAVKAAIPKRLMPSVIHAIKQCGGADIVVSELSQIVQ